ncbi:MAG: lipocalin family protein [Planctomycetota bacterium]
MTPKASLRQRALTRLPLLGSALALAGCASRPPLPTVQEVDLERFMGDWYVQAHIPAGAEKNAYNGVESYALGEDGEILTSYVFREGAFDGALETKEPKGVVRDTTTNATWGMQFFWPLEFEYLVAHLDSSYSETIIARTKRDYAWIMTRDPMISDERMESLTARLAEMGYDTGKLRRVPQQWPDDEHPVSKAGGDLATWTRENS